MEVSVCQLSIYELPTNFLQVFIYMCALLIHHVICCFRRAGWFRPNVYGAGSGNILLDNVRCTGRESDIGSCAHRGWGVHSCSHSEDVAISCVTVETQRLPGKNEYSAIVNVFCIFYYTYLLRLFYRLIPLVEKRCITLKLKIARSVSEKNTNQIFFTLLTMKTWNAELPKMSDLFNK